jgi:hypothetical protein
LDEKLHKKFSKIVKENGSKKKFTITKMVEDFVLNAEANPGYFDLIKRRRENEERC